MHRVAETMTQVLEIARDAQANARAVSVLVGVPHGEMPPWDEDLFSGRCIAVRPAVVASLTATSRCSCAGSSRQDAARPTGHAPLLTRADQRACDALASGQIAGGDRRVLTRAENRGDDINRTVQTSLRGILGAGRADGPLDSGRARPRALFHRHRGRLLCSRSRPRRTSHGSAQSRR